MGTISRINRNRKIYSERKENGLCVVCSEKAEDDKNHCKKHLEKLTKNHKKYIKTKRECWKKQSKPKKIKKV